MYGVNLKYMTPMYGAMIGSAVGGLIAGIGKCTAYAMIGSAGVLGGLPVFLGGGTSNFLWMVAGVVAGIVVTGLVVWAAKPIVVAPVARLFGTVSER